MNKVQTCSSGSEYKGEAHILVTVSHQSLSFGCDRRQLKHYYVVTIILVSRIITVVLE